MEILLEKSRKKLKSAPLEFKRFLYQRINYDQRLISILGARGVGKTTLIQQIGTEWQSRTSLYIALDDLFFTDNTLYGLAEDFNKIGGDLLLLDEVHKYPDWSKEIKLIYDDFPEMKVIFTSSSVLDIYHAESDLSRRASRYFLPEMSFREYLEFYHSLRFSSLSLKDIVNSHEDITYDMSDKFKPFKYFTGYLRHGNYPYYQGDEYDYHQKLRNTVNLVLDVDIPAIQKVDYESIARFKRLLYVLAANVPFTPNISKLSERINLNRNALVQAIQLLGKAELLHTLYKQSRSISHLNKPDKILLHNPNLNYALGNNNPDTGNLRETFFVSQLSVDHRISLPTKGDFRIDEKYIFEVGGKHKTKKQILNQTNAYLVKDHLEIGVINNIPLWLFGFLY